MLFCVIENIMIRKTCRINATEIEKERKKKELKNEKMNKWTNQKKRNEEKNASKTKTLKSFFKKLLVFHRRAN